MGNTAACIATHWVEGILEQSSRCNIPELGLAELVQVEQQEQLVPLQLAVQPCLA